MLPVEGQLEEAIRTHERLLVSRQQYLAKLEQKSMVVRMISRTREMEIKSLREALARVEEEIAAVELEIEELRGNGTG